jgi:hypothetical protein
MQYHHPSANNSRVFDSPFQIRNREDLAQVREAMRNIDIHEWAGQQGIIMQESSCKWQPVPAAAGFRTRDLQIILYRENKKKDTVEKSSLQCAKTFSKPMYFNVLWYI